MKVKLFAICALTFASAFTDRAAAQSTADTLAIELAAAQHFKPWFAGKIVMLDSRFMLGHGAAERPSERTQQIAQILGLQVAHFEDVIGCKANCALVGTNTAFAVAIRLPTIKGDTAVVGIETWGVNGTSRAAVTYGVEEILAKINGIWTFVRTGRATWS
jgi:hypothetical protein